MSLAIVWFRQDLRLHDNPALCAAMESGMKVLPIYILDDGNAGAWKMGGASRVWLHHSLHALNESLEGALAIFTGDAETILLKLVQDTGASVIFWNRCYEPWRIARDKKIKSSIGLHVATFQASLLWEPWKILKADQTPYKVFTPFYRKGCLLRDEPRAPLDRPKKINLTRITSQSINDLDLLPNIRWDKNMVAHWQIGEQGARQRLGDFLEDGFAGYKEGRNYPQRNNVSRLSPHLHFGEISPHEAWHTAKRYALAHRKEQDLDNFHSELAWREFSHHLLYHFPHLPEKPFQEKFADFPWREYDGESLNRWRKGLTGCPIVDAGMRELWATGYMHNRVRMIAASFLVKDLLLPWQYGEEWFWDCLFDADLANNAAGWQWVAGCGADAAPYFRIFNPVTQGEKFDPTGAYIRRWVPELAHLDNADVHAPWNAVTPPAHYPHRMVDHAAARQAALEALKKIKNSA